MQILIMFQWVVISIAVIPNLILGLKRGALKSVYFFVINIMLAFFILAIISDLSLYSLFKPEEIIKTINETNLLDSLEFDFSSIDYLVTLGDIFYKLIVFFTLFFNITSTIMFLFKAFCKSNASLILFNFPTGTPYKSNCDSQKLDFFFIKTFSSMAFNFLTFLSLKSFVLNEFSFNKFSELVAWHSFSNNPSFPAAMAI